MSFGITAATVLFTVGSVAVTAGAIATTAAVIGTSLVVAGMVTKNKTLSKIGLGFSIASGVMGLTFAATSLFGTAVGTGANALGMAPELAAQTAPTLSGVAAAAASAAPPVTGAFAPAAAPLVPASSLSGSVAGVSAFAPTGATLGSSLTPTAAPLTQALAPAAPAPTPSLNIQGGMRESSRLGLGPNTFQTADFSSSLNDTAKAVAKNESLWGSLDPTTKFGIMNAAGQTIAGGVGGIFSGMQADEQMKLQRLIDQENRQQEFNRANRATSTPGLIQFSH